VVHGVSANDTPKHQQQANDDKHAYLLLEDEPEPGDAHEIVASRDDQHYPTIPSIGGQMEKFESDLTTNWVPVLEQLLIGVSHHISNRVSTLAGVSDILSEDPTIPPILRALASEVPKLEESIRLLRLLAAPAEPEEAVEPLRLVGDAIGLAELHPEMRGVVYRIDAVEAPPVLGYPVKLTHQIVMALVAAGAAGGGEVVVRVSVEGGDVVINARERVVRARTLAAARADETKNASENCAGNF
jgi:hypothetical protein